MKSVLEAEGIRCEMRNVMSAGLSAVVPVSESMPELWVVEEAELPRALKVAGDIKTESATEGVNWTCTECGEELEPQFGSCWKCNTPKSG